MLDALNLLVTVVGIILLGAVLADLVDLKL